MKNPIKKWIIKVVTKEIEQNGIVIGNKLIKYADGKLILQTEK